MMKCGNSISAFQISICPKQSDQRERKGVRYYRKARFLEILEISFFLFHSSRDFFLGGCRGGEGGCTGLASAMWKGSSQEVGGVLLWRYGVVFVLYVWFRGSCPLASYCHILCDQYQLWICCFESHPPSLRGSLIPKCLTPPFNPLSPCFSSLVVESRQCGHCLLSTTACGC